MDEPKNARCSLCGTPLAKVLFEASSGKGERWTILECAPCGVAFTVPVPTEEELSRFYRSGNYRGATGDRFHPAVEAVIRWGRNRRRKRIEAFIPGGSILDVGCGRGFFLSVMKRAGWDALGVEVDPATAAAASSMYGLTVLPGEIARIGLPPGRFDVITMSHVLEHVRDPAGAVRECAKLLRPGGLLLVAVPNLSSLQSAFGKGSWFHLDPPFHLQHFREDGLVRLLQGSGFSIRRVRRFDVEYNPYGWLQTLLNRVGIRRNLLYDMLKNPELRGGGIAAVTGLAATALLLPAVLPLAFALAALESLVRRGGTVEVLAFRSGKPGEVPG